MKEFGNGGIKLRIEQFFSYRLLSARMVTECAFGRLKARFFPHVIHVYSCYNCSSCFILHNFCEINTEQVNRQHVTDALKYDAEFQPLSQGSYEINNKEGQGKNIRNTFVKYFQ